MREADGKETEYPICEKWQDTTDSMGVLALIAQSTSFSVVLINFILRNVLIFLLGHSKFNQFSKLANATMYSVLLVSFFNYGVLYVIAPWNFSEQGVDDGDFFSGIYTDFNSQWFLDIGKLITETTLFNIVSPVLEYLLFWLFRYLKRMYDQRTCCPCNKRNTNAKTIM